ncbi:MAG: outer rane lipoprotein SlyB [Shewanella sp.]|jgi:outer membrane lipoprotein SlyB|uniref:glycine zipper 2TM domain-containing protein n=1 Tax=Shewanella TaxID=22 RepID=UPI00167BE63B|nr:MULTISPECIES: glycine zipper 2TM domain-containing protein [Shewanella]MBO1271389.1 glycine zipper 2TM domain-containing protein [Shewanella sp. 4t3-1-2LB]MCL2905368.1 glycine zipper 2TM domain-containing protein [Shewanella fodinae]MDN5368798.1 outer rane lipoprotein SlyB [Shewanella sp.]GGY90501.1 membrane protein [Shewanella fodinae]
MWKTLFSVFVLSVVLIASAQAGYDRNQAVPVEKVLYGQVESVRDITQQQLVEDKNSGWRTFGGALLGGVIGNQFGSGHGRDITTVLGAIVGAGIGNNSGRGSYYRQTQLIELMIRQEDNTQVMIIQDKDPGMLFNPGDEVRVVYLKGSVRVDKAM